MTRRLDSAIRRAEAWLVRLDPAPRPTPLSTQFLLCFLFLVALTMWLVGSNKYLPGQDISYHAHCSRVWLEGGRAGSPYALYEPGHPLEANTLMYTVAGVMSYFGSSFTAFRLVQCVYLVGLPIACLYALRALGRSPWGSLLAFPLCYTEMFAAGYANMAFAAPSFILALVEYRRFTQAPSVRRGVVTSALFVVVFLSHAHVYLWLGGLLLLYSLAVFVRRLLDAASMGPRDALRSVLVFVGGGVAVAAPSLALFARWYARGYGSGNSVGAGGNDVSFTSSLVWLPLPQKFMGGVLQAFSATTNVNEVPHLLALAALVTLAMALARVAHDRSPPLPELAVLVTTASYYVLPDTVALQMVAVRQWYFVFWMLPLVVVPVSLKVGPVRSLVVIGALLAWTGARMAVITSHLRRFTTEEMVGFDRVVAAAPKTPGLLLAYSTVSPRSRYWLTSSMFHSYGFLSAQRSYDGPLEYSDARSVAAVRYTNGPPKPIKHLYGNAQWPLDPGIWEYDLVLVHRWAPTPAQRQVAEGRGALLAASGDWQLWRSLKP
ncbi:MAG: hypothetical protein KF850_04110 [Labilithrix sp.]|nr:hypothetical protein [Labilithrix sp.]